MQSGHKFYNIIMFSHDTDSINNEENVLAINCKV